METSILAEVLTNYPYKRLTNFILEFTQKIIHGAKAPIFTRWP